MNLIRAAHLLIEFSGEQNMRCSPPNTSVSMYGKAGIFGGFGIGPGYHRVKETPDCSILPPIRSRSAGR